MGEAGCVDDGRWNGDPLMTRQIRLLVNEVFSQPLPKFENRYEIDR